ncbi:predicted protein [Lichtheimia corymbifera JMRC:FSU:9682]|uniref:SRP9 domain-containing protein n=1 Tax=Lichtheimia corymbifera JMRC:FSU:9682 TaxID=1263082 RepID=A0A068RIG9_9FUNG|nr:predicted protein [Lichtheimia corymbifera JMRC:FSU:9682]
MYISNWDEFQKAVEELYTTSPERTRYVSRFRHSDGELILKVTDDRKIVKYKTNQATDLKRFTRMNLNLMCKMQNRVLEEPAIPPPATTSQPEAVPASSSPKPQQKNKKNKKKK